MRPWLSTAFSQFGRGRDSRRNIRSRRSRASSRSGPTRSSRGRRARRRARHRRGQRWRRAPAAAGRHARTDTRRIPVVAARIAVPAVMRPVARRGGSRRLVVAVTAARRRFPGRGRRRTAIPAAAAIAAGRERGGGERGDERDMDRGALFHSAAFWTRAQTITGGTQGTTSCLRVQNRAPDVAVMVRRPWSAPRRARRPRRRRPDRPGSSGGSASDRRPARRRAGCRSGCSARRSSASEMLSRYLTSARRLLPCAAMITRLPDADRRRDRRVPVRQEPRDRVLQRLGERQLGRRRDRVARIARRVTRVVRRRAAAAGCRSCGARSSPAPRRASRRSRPCSAPAARRSAARSAASPSSTGIHS